MSGICQPAVGAGCPFYSRGSIVEQRPLLLLLAAEAVFPAGLVLETECE